MWKELLDVGRGCPHHQGTDNILPNEAPQQILGPLRPRTDSPITTTITTVASESLFRHDVTAVGRVWHERARVP
jgi:hypothetical protein